MLGRAKFRRLTNRSPSRWRTGPADNFYRHLEAKLDLGFVRDLGARAPMPSGADRAIDPVVFFKLQLVMFFEGIRSERQLIETASLNLAHRWYLGYALDEELPDHSSLTRIRQRLGSPSSSASSSTSSTCARRPAWSGARSSTSTPPRSSQRRPRLARAPLLSRGQDARRPTCSPTSRHRCGGG